MSSLHSTTAGDAAYWEAYASTLQRAALAVARSNGPAPFDELLAALTSGLGADFGVVVALDGSARRPEVLAARHAGAVLTDIDERLAALMHRARDAGTFRWETDVRELTASYPTLCTLASVALFDSGGLPLGALCIAHRSTLDSTELVQAMLTLFGARMAAEIERRRAHEALRLREEQYRVIFEASSDGFVLRDKHLRTVDANPAFYRMYGFAPEHIAAGGGYPTQFPREYVEERDEQIRRALKGEATHVETIALRADGQSFWIDLRVIPVRYRGEPHVLQVVRDITRRREAEAQREALAGQLRQAQKMEAIGQLTGGIAHDFNNILTSVIGYIVLASERVEGHGDQRVIHQLDQAHLAAQRARDLIAQMLTFSRRGRSERRPLDLAPVLRQSLTLLRSTLPSTIEVEVNLSGTLAPVRADQVQIEQVLFNLCINARDAMAGAGRLRVALRGCELRSVCASCREPFAGRWVELAVSDDGEGVSAAVLERMFDPFYTTKEVGRGSGMGLAMVHGIVHEHGGHVVVDAEPTSSALPSPHGTVARQAPGGTTIRILLPPGDPVTDAGASTAAALAGPGEAREPPPRLIGRIMLVEDETMVGAYMVELLQGWGLSVGLFRDPLEAERHFGIDPLAWDVVLTDQAMPRLSGAELATRLLALRPELPLLLYSGFQEGLDEGRVKSRGVRAVLHKPIDRDQLLRALRDCLS